MRGSIGRPSASCGGLGAAVRLEQADHDVAARLLFGVTLEQHAVGLADPRRHPEEDLQATAAADRQTQSSVSGASGAVVSLGHPPSRLWTIRSISLMPMNGAMMPPRP